MGRIKLDLHDIYNNSKAIDHALQSAFEQAVEKKNQGSGNHTRQRKRATQKKSRKISSTTTYQAIIPQDRKRQQKFRTTFCIFPFR